MVKQGKFGTKKVKNTGQQSRKDRVIQTGTRGKRGRSGEIWFERTGIREGLTSATIGKAIISVQQKGGKTPQNLPSNRRGQDEKKVRVGSNRGSMSFYGRTQTVILPLVGGGLENLGEYCRPHTIRRLIDVGDTPRGGVKGYQEEEPIGVNCKKHAKH